MTTVIFAGHYEQEDVTLSALETVHRHLVTFIEDLKKRGVSLTQITTTSDQSPLLDVLDDRTVVSLLEQLDVNRVTKCTFIWGRLASRPATTLPSWMVLECNSGTVIAECKWGIVNEMTITYEEAVALLT